MQLLFESFDRSVYYVPGSSPAVFFLADREGGGILINSPRYSPELLATLDALLPLKFIFYPSYLGAADADAWREASGAKTMAYGHEAKRIDGTVDLILERENRFSRTIDFFAMSGRTESSCALRCKNKPGLIFFGPVLSTAESGWPTLKPQPDDYSYENRLFGVLGLQDVKFEYAFTDDFDPRTSRFGPGADMAIQRELAQIFD
ncbi:MAG: MBL fold metallo-hydrolase [Burkholderiales bacterium]